MLPLPWEKLGVLGPTNFTSACCFALGSQEASLQRPEGGKQSQMKVMEARCLHAACGFPGYQWRLAAVGYTFSLCKQALPLGFIFKVSRRGGGPVFTGITQEKVLNTEPAITVGWF